MNTMPLVSELHERPHSSWDTFLSKPEIRTLLTAIESQITASTQPVIPPRAVIMRFMLTDMLASKIIIIGQDPYPQEGAATGRCFEVGTLHRWEDTFRNVSLKNIVRALYSADKDETIGYRQITARIADGWELLPPQLLFKDWEAQGVLLLNTAFTCQLGNAGSHTELWKTFTELLLRHICEANPQLIWFVWGRHAQKHTDRLPIRHKLISQHPMMCYAGDGRDDDFLFGKTNMFKETAHLIHWTGSNFREQTKNIASKGLFY